MVNWTEVRNTTIPILLGIIIVQVITSRDMTVALLSVVVLLLSLRISSVDRKVTTLKKQDAEAFDKLLSALHNLDEAKDRLGLDTEELT